MPEPIKLSISDPQVKSLLAVSFPTYRGRKVKAQLWTDPVGLDLNWSGGSRDQAVIVDFVSGHATHLRAPSPFSREGHEPTEIPPDSVLVVHSIFMGKDAGINFYVRPGAHTPPLGLRP